MTFFDSQLMFVCDQLNLKILDVNEFAVSKLKYSKKELVGRSLSFLGKNIELDQAEFEELGLPFIETWLLYTKDKEKLYVQFSSHLINYNGVPAKVVVAHDVTSILAKKMSVRKAFSLPIGFHDFPLAEIEWNLDHKVLRWSKRAELLFGYTHLDINKNPYLLEDLIADDDFEKMTSANKDAQEENAKTKVVKLTNRTREGSEIECEWYNSYLYDKDGNVMSIYSVIKDITEERKAQRKSEQLMSSFMDLYNSITDAIYLLDIDGKIVNANAGLTRNFGYSQSEVLGKDVKFLSASGKYSEEKVNEFITRARNG